MSQDLTANNEPWIKLQSVPKGLEYGAVLSLNYQQFILAPNGNHTKDGLNEIIRYDIHHNEWKQLIKYPQDFTLIYHGMAFNAVTNELYLYDLNAQMTIIDMVSRKFQIIEDGAVHDKAYPSLECVDGRIHLIGAQKYDKKTGLFQLQCTENMNINLKQII